MMAEGHLDFSRASTDPSQLRGTARCHGYSNSGAGCDRFRLLRRQPTHRRAGHEQWAV